MLKASVESKITDLRSQISCLMCHRLRCFFFPLSKLSHIKAYDVKFFPLYASIFLESSKTDQFHDGAWMVIPRSDSIECIIGIAWGSAYKTHLKTLQSKQNTVLRLMFFNCNYIWALH